MKEIIKECRLLVDKNKDGIITGISFEIGKENNEDMITVISSDSTYRMDIDDENLDRVMVRYVDDELDDYSDIFTIGELLDENKFIKFGADRTYFFTSRKIYGGPIEIIRSVPLKKMYISYEEWNI